MSLLLDALKKAALEKQKRDQSGSSGEPETDSSIPDQPAKVDKLEPPVQTIDLVDDLTVEAPSVPQIITLEDDETTTPTAQNTSSDLGELVDENQRATPLELSPTPTPSPPPTLELQENGLELAKPSTKAPPSSPSLESGENTNELSLQITDDISHKVPTNNDLDANQSSSKVQTGDVDRSSAADNSAGESKKSGANAKIQPTESDRPSKLETSGAEVPNPEDSTPVDSAPNNSDPDDDKNRGSEGGKPTPAPSQFNDADAKAAMAHLLDSGRKTARNQSIRSFVALFALFITALGVVALYYYYLQDDGPSQFNIPDAPFETASEDSELPTEESESDAVSMEDTAEAIDASVATADSAPETNTSTDADLIETIETSAETSTPSPTKHIDKTPLKTVTQETPDRNPSNYAAGSKETDKQSISGPDKSTPEKIKISKEEWDTRLANGRESGQSQTDSAPKVSKSSVQKTTTTTQPKKPNATQSKKADTNNSARQLSIQRNSPTESPLSIAIQQGYLAYQNGQLQMARAAYDEALRISPYHRDALLGAAAVAVREHRYEQALHWYQARINRAPTDDHAKAGLMALAATQNPGPKLASEVNNLLRDFPGAAHLHFLKGSLSAASKQWGAAQSSFFEATQLDRQNPDYIYNLAVSLDHLRQPKDALRYYQQALNISDYRQAGFNKEALQKRISALEASAK